MSKRTIRLAAAAVLSILMALAAPPATAQTFKDAMAAYERGDYAAALAGFRILAAQGDAPAQFNLGLMYDNGQGVPQDYTEAAKWYRRAAAQGDAPAQFNLGVMYGNGEGVPQDYAEAAKWYRRAAAQGHASARFNLGLMYGKGEGVPQDYMEAAKWYRRAAAQGDAPAQFNLGVMYGNGEGVPQDYAEAAKWYRRAAAQGHAFAQNNLGVMYEDGKGVPRDHVRAHVWFNLAAARFPAAEKDRRAKAIRNRDRVARLLSPEALARAQRLAREWKPGAGAGPASPPPAAENRNADERRRIVAIQLALVRLGYQPGPADGVLGQKTRAAIRAFQASVGLPVDGRPSDRLKRALALAEAKAAPAPKPAPVRPALARASTGSGFRVSADGRVLTNAHVVRGCAEVRVLPAGPATVVARDEAADLALINGPPGAAAAFRQGRGVRSGAPVVVVGYPLRGVLAAGANVSTGSVAALAGIRGDRRKIQITAPVQPGNSGGPVLDAAGNAVGVVVSRLDALRMARATGRVPQNVNFAVSAAAARAFLDSEGVPYETASSNRARAPEDVAAAAKAFTVLIECWK